jgi:hypothetical protein
MIGLIPFVGPGEAPSHDIDGLAEWVGEGVLHPA